MDRPRQLSEVRGLMVFLPFLKLLIAHSATLDLCERILVETAWPLLESHPDISDPRLFRIHKRSYPPRLGLLTRTSSTNQARSPTGRWLSADVVKLASYDVPGREHANSLARACEV